MEIEGLREIFKRPLLSCLYRRKHCVLCADGDDAQLRALALDASYEIQAIFIRHDHVGDHEIALTLLQPAPQPSRASGGPDFIALSRQGLGQDGANGAIVIRQKYLCALHESSSSHSGSNSRKTVWPASLSKSITPP